MPRPASQSSSDSVDQSAAAYRPRWRKAVAVLTGVPLILAVLSTFSPASAGAAVPFAPSSEAASNPVIVPTPQQQQFSGSPLSLTAVEVVAGSDTDPAAKALLLQSLQASGISNTVGATKLFLGPGTRSDIANVLGSNATPQKPEGYALKVSASGIAIGGFDAAGQYYGVQSFRQLLTGNKVAQASLVDWPAMPIRGSIEGFYGMPWNQQERLDQLAFYGDLKMNTYIYAPKDDPYHRSKWRDPYPVDKLAELKALVDESQKHHVRFTFALSPGESVCFSSQADREAAIAKMQAMYDVGVRAFSIPLDDISYTKWNCSADQTAYGTPGSGNAGKAQVSLLNYLNTNFIKTHSGTFPLQMVPTEYSDIKTSPYKQQFKANLQSDIVIMWTGTDVVPPSISNADASAIAAVWGRKVFLWDNYPVNDFGQTTGRLLMGAYDKREAGLSASLLGVVSNPMNQSSASKPAIAGVAGFSWNDTKYDANSTWLWSLNYLAKGNAELAAALQTFADLNFAAPTFGPNFWLPQSPALGKLSDAFKAAPKTADLSALKNYANSMVSGSSLIPAKLSDKIFVQDAAAWLTAEKPWGVALQKAIAAVEAARSGQQDAVQALVDASNAAVDQARAVKITDQKNTWSASATPAPKLGDGVLDVLINLLIKTASNGGENYALNSPEVKASGVEPGTSFVAKNAVDGVATTRWASNYADNAWIQVKLTQPVLLSTVNINWETACATAYKLQTSVDGVSWKDIAVDKPVCSGVQKIVVNSTTAVNYLRVQGIKRATQWGYSIFEIEAYGVPAAS
ncbi:beta-N-acetylglucosaminidase domain-containing protein [Psychromicrobium lacuslunae]|uniref:beta-N-acetylglucosaminidase domain-containing protein n=1 Tax=Psychromicrobium lacuslunae TaxID=1618207 RepID=UPI0009E47921|nr:beta-N-acetylglucosaminidase domain-containing protein [Psychromicrobium lacuslunae]